jgi:hypothetical protein
MDAPETSISDGWLVAMISPDPLWLRDSFIGLCY